MRLKILFVAAFLAVIIASFLVSAKFQKTLPENIKAVQERFQNNNTFREQIRNRLQICRNNSNVTCNETREQARNIAIGFLSKICSNYSEILERLETKINNSRKLSEEEKANLTQVLESKKAQLEQLCSRLNETNNITEIREIFRELKNLIRETNQLVRGHFFGSHERRVGLVIERMSHMEEKLERFLEKYNGKDKEELQDLLQQFRAKIQQANSTYQESKTLWQQAMETMRNGGDASELIKQANEKMQESQRLLREAHTILMQIIRILVGGEK